MPSLQRQKNAKEKMKYNLFLDDVRKPTDVKWLDLPPVDWVIVRNYENFEKIIRKAGLPSIISFDHDLTPISL